MSGQAEPFTDEEIAPALPRDEQAPSPGEEFGSSPVEEFGSPVEGFGASPEEEAGSVTSSVLIRASKSGIQKSTVGKRLKSLDGRVEDLEHINDEKKMEQLPLDTHSLPMATKSGLVSVLFSLGIYSTQMFIYLVLLVNSPLRRNNPEDSFPNGVTVTIRVAQYIALFISVYTQQDTVDALLLWKSGFDAISSYTHDEDFDIPIVGQRWRYQFCVSLRFFVGVMGMMATWVLIAQSDEAVDLLLNFTAVEFVASLDGSAFQLCLHGFVGDRLKADAEKISSVRYSINEDKYRWRRYLLLIFLLLMFGALITLSVRQVERKVGDNELYVQFDDAVVPELSAYSGLYEGAALYEGARALDGMFPDGNGAIIYQKKGASWPYPFFGYCLYSTRWIFFFEPEDLPSSQKKLTELKLCGEKGETLYSNMDGAEIKRSNEFDLLSHRGAQWLYQGKEKITEISIVMVPSSEMQGFYERVKSRQDSTCGAGVRLTGEGGGHLFGLVERPKDTTWFANRPRYVYNNTDYILFNGYRWIYTSGVNESSDVSIDALNPQQVSRISEPVKYLSEKDSFFPSADLTWYEAIDTVRPSSGQAGIDKSTFILCEIECDATDALLQFEITTDLYPSETYIGLFNHSLLVSHQDLKNTTPVVKKKETGSFTFSDSAAYDVLQGGPFDQSSPQQSYTYRACVNKNDTNYLVLRDNYGDGFDGSYELQIDGMDALNGTDISTDWKYCTALHLDLPNYNTQGTVNGVVTPVKCTLEMQWISQDAELAGQGSLSGEIAFTCNDFNPNSFCSQLDGSGTPCDVCAVCDECQALCQGCSNFDEQVLQDTCSFCDSPTTPTAASPVAPTSPAPTVAPVSP